MACLQPDGPAGPTVKVEMVRFTHLHTRVALYFPLQVGISEDLVTGPRSGVSSYAQVQIPFPMAPGPGEAHGTAGQGLQGILGCHDHHLTSPDAMH